MGAYDYDQGPELSDLPPLPTVKTQLSPIPSDTAARNCTAWYTAPAGGGLTCRELVLIFGRFSSDDFARWNPSVDCRRRVDGSSAEEEEEEEEKSLEPKMWYCVGVPGTPTTRTEPLPTAYVSSVP